MFLYRRESACWTDWTGGQCKPLLREHGARLTTRYDLKNQKLFKVSAESELKVTKNRKTRHKAKSEAS